MEPTPLIPQEDPQSDVAAAVRAEQPEQPNPGVPRIGYWRDVPGFDSLSPRERNLVRLTEKMNEADLRKKTVSEVSNAVAVGAIAKAEDESEARAEALQKKIDDYYAILNGEPPQMESPTLNFGEGIATLLGALSGNAREAAQFGVGMAQDRVKLAFENASRKYGVNRETAMLMFRDALGQMQDERQFQRGLELQGIQGQQAAEARAEDREFTLGRDDKLFGQQKEILGMNQTFARDMEESQRAFQAGEAEKGRLFQSRQAFLDRYQNAVQFGLKFGADREDAKWEREYKTEVQKWARESFGQEMAFKEKQLAATIAGQYADRQIAWAKHSVAQSPETLQGFIQTDKDYRRSLYRARDAAEDKWTGTRAALVQAAQAIKDAGYPARIGKGNEPNPLWAALDKAQAEETAAKAAYQSAERRIAEADQGFDAGAIPIKPILPGGLKDGQKANGAKVTSETFFPKGKQPEAKPPFDDWKVLK